MSDAAPHLTPGSPDWEEERLRALRRLDFLYDDRRAELERICKLTCELLGVARTSISMVDRDTVRFLSASVGLETRSRDGAFSAAVLPQDEVLDTADFAPGAFDGKLGPLRNCLGAPFGLRPGLNLGVLCAGDVAPRVYSSRDKANLKAMAELVVDQIRLHIATEDAQAREALIAEGARLANVGVWELDLETRQLNLSSQAQAILGQPRNEPLGAAGLVRMLGGDARITMAESLEALCEEGRPFDFEGELTTSQDLTRWVRMMGHADLRDGRVVRVYGALQDVTARKSADDQIHHLAHHDGLTGLPNRALFNQKLATALAQASADGARVGVALVDFDHFKMINDTKGHAAGDRLLQVSAERMRAVVGRHGAAARLGGDEFAVVLTGLDSAEAIVALCERLAEALQDPIPFGAEMIAASASMGVTLFPDDHHEASELLKNADIALYLAKSARRGRPAYFMPKLREQFEERVNLMKDVRRGLTEGEFELHYQPICSVDGGKDARVVGFEALMRWRHPTKGLLAPPAFAVAFEEVDLACALGDVSLLQVIDRICGWKREGVDFGYISLNVNQAQIASGGFFAQVAEEVRSGVIPADKLVIEVTESVYLSSNPERVAAQLVELHDLGVRIALDDFGTGYASLTHLKQFPIDMLKVDRSFIQRIGVDPDNTAITMAVINLGKALGMDVVAEGVENREQSALLSLCGCHHMQGFYYAKALAADAVPSFLKECEADAERVNPKREAKAWIF
jgi:diguanylate cyclase (GGDEF)-like protein